MYKQTNIRSEIREFKKSLSAGLVKDSEKKFACLMNHTYFALILVHGLNLGHGFDLTNVCEFQPLMAKSKCNHS